MGMMLLLKGGSQSVAALALTGALFHLVNHAVFKALLFLNAGAIEYMTGIRDLRKLGGLGSSMPVTSTTSLGASMAISGMPPFNGFFSKLLIIIAAVQGEFYLLAALAVLVNFVTLGTFLKFYRHVFQNTSGQDPVPSVQKLPFSMKFSMITLLVLCVFMSLLLVPSLRETVLQPAVNVLINYENYANILTGI
jgi:multicomponent Na+:H+ antiporter subunit D